MEPVTFPIAESAESLCLAACIDAKVSGRDVPSATNVIAVTYGRNPITQPNKVANSATTAVIIPINTREITKANHPPHALGGGTRAKSS